MRRTVGIVVVAVVLFVSGALTGAYLRPPVVKESVRVERIDVERGTHIEIERLMAEIARLRQVMERNVNTRSKTTIKKPDGTVVTKEAETTDTTKVTTDREVTKGTKETTVADEKQKTSSMTTEQARESPAPVKLRAPDFLLGVDAGVVLPRLFGGPGDGVVPRVPRWAEISLSIDRKLLEVGRVSLYAGGRVTSNGTVSVSAKLGW